MNCPADLRTGLATGRPRTAPAPALTPALTMFFSATVGVIVLNLFAAQPLTGPIAAELRLPASLTGLVAMLPQLGYAAGLVLLVPLVDLLENRRLIVTTLAVCAATLALPAVTRSGAVYLAAVFAAGAASSVIQMLVPMAASMAPDERRGRAVGNVMSGLMLGILLSRPLASLIAGAAGWRAFYGAAAAADIAIAAVLAAKLPLRAPQLSMAAFSAFWTAIGLRLAAAPFDLGLHGIAMFAFAGATGAIVTPFAGLAGDRGRERDALRGAHVAMLAALAALGVAGAGWGGFDTAAHPALALALLVAGAAALDAGVVADQTLGRRAINLLDPAMRGRLNGLFVGLFFVGGSLGAVLAGAAWAWAGWGAVCAVGLVFAGAAFALDWIGAHGPAPR
ncbi:major Facilitator Superfamily protein [Burkholderia pseudomallei MSHR7334]|uniref:MFS transporter n=1 Tax=Burkholderia pseudomallei TaxID=28450 RepID=UPI000531F9F5|nr:MFS transporter [Burkholderia pseudomallei]KGS78303.1 major Facilitator Superfamily protein [Burkholderia pseudomallei MSHR7334]